jgi:PadR family transcriptional regulator PadR
MPLQELDVLQGTLNVLVLRAFSWHPMHGYAVARFIRDASGERFQTLDGALYTSRQHMEELRWVECSWGQSDKGKRAKFYETTGTGRRARKTETALWSKYVTAVAGVMHARPEHA